jgi:hypothetical protein
VRLATQGETLEEYERNRLSQIKQDQNQMTLLPGAQLKKQEHFLGGRASAERDEDCYCQPVCYFIIDMILVAFLVNRPHS